MVVLISHMVKRVYGFTDAKACPNPNFYTRKPLVSIKMRDPLYRAKRQEFAEPDRSYTEA